MIKHLQTSNNQFREYEFKVFGTPLLTLFRKMGLK